MHITTSDQFLDFAFYARVNTFPVFYLYFNNKFFHLFVLLEVVIGLPKEMI